MKKITTLCLCLILAAGLLCSCTSSPKPVGDADAKKATEGPSAVPTEAVEDTPGPTEEARAGFDEADAIEAAIPVANEIGRVNGCEFDTEGAECTVFESDEETEYLVSFPAREIGGTLNVTVCSNSAGEYSIPFSGLDYGPGGHNEEDNMWRETFGAEPITVTPEDIAASGCTATEGDEYMRAVYECFAAKAAERLVGAEEGVPARCIEAAPVYCEPDEDFPGMYMVKLAVIPADLYSYARFCDGGVTFCPKEYSEEYYCRAIFLGRPVLTQGSDGSWTGSLNWDIRN